MITARASTKPLLGAGTEHRTRKPGCGGRGLFAAAWAPCKQQTAGGGVVLHIRGAWSGLNLYKYIIQRIKTATETKIQTSS